MSELGWITRWRAELPPGDRWLGPREREVLSGLRFPKRRDDWLLGRFTAKLAVADWLGVRFERVEVIAADDGAPEAYAYGGRMSLALSLSHRAGRAVAVVADAPTKVGCDIELVEPRSNAFVREWLSPPEQALVASSGSGRTREANLLWTAKEAAAKLRREGLRLDMRHAVTDLGPVGENGYGWHPMRVSWSDGGTAAGWWRAEPGWVLAVSADPAPEEPRELGR